MIKILFLAANPNDTDRLRLDEEMRAIDAAVRQGKYRDQFEIRSHWAVRINDLQELLLRYKPDIVHFSGHGSNASEIILQDEQGKTVLVPPDTLSNLFGLLKDNIRCVVLNACYSEGQADGIAKHIDCVVGMSTVLSDDAARNFSTAFYGALGYGRSVQKAFELGRSQIDLSGLREQYIPQLLAPNTKPTQVYFVTDDANTQPSETQSTIIQYLSKLIQGVPPEERELKNRSVMLQRVREYWIDGVLEQSLFRSVLIKLEMSVKAEAVVVKRPWNISVQTAEQVKTQLPSDKQIIDVFDQMQQSMLILGEPGSGKTTTLLELARDLIKRAEDNQRHPIPVIFNLSSWANNQESIANWVIDELTTRYSIPKPLAKTWIEKEAILPLLDGLDEVEERYRTRCIQKINEYLQTRTSITASIVVCCRVDEYDSAATRLSLQSAILIEPLTTRQVNGYFDALGDEFHSIKQKIQQEHSLLELTQSPFMLNIIAITFSGVKPDELSRLQFTESHQEELFNRYIKKAFTYRGEKESLYSRQQTLYWLARLANQLHTHQQTIFLLELMQPSWLPTKGQKLQFALIGGLIGGLIGWLCGGVVGGLFGGMIGGLAQKIIPRHQWEWDTGKKRLAVGLVYGLTSGLTMGWRSSMNLEMRGWLIIGLITGLGFGLFWGLHDITIETVTSYPNQGIKESGKNALLFVLTFGLFVGLAVGLIGGQKDNLVFGLKVGLFVGLIGGGIAWLHHYVLRYVLSKNGSIPWDYARFLDYCHNRNFLRKVGGGYIFIHRMLMEHFANMTDEDIKGIAVPIE